MKTKAVPISWVIEEGHRFDCGPFTRGGIEAKKTLEVLSVPKSSLVQLTQGGLAGLYHVGMDKLRWVDGPEYGVPFLRSADILRADLSGQPYISRAQVQSNSLFTCPAGSTLITRSGTIGRMAYCRDDMAQMAMSQDVLKVVPDTTAVPSGYLYAFLSSKYGVPLVVSGTFGSIIVHIEAENIANLPVPRLGDAVEQQAHELMELAATNLSRYGTLLQKATTSIFEALGFDDLKDEDWFADDSHLGWPQRDFKWGTLRAFNYDPRLSKPLSYLESHVCDELISLVEPASFKGHIVFKRIDCEPEHGRMLVGQRQAFQLRPEGRWISNKSIDGLGLVVPPQTTLIPSHGTLGETELYCRAVYVTRRTSAYAFSGDFYRCIPISHKVPPGYLFAFLRSRLAFRLLRAMSTGSKQQYQHPSMIAAMPIPRLAADVEATIAAMVDEASRLYDTALDSEDAARALVERATAEAA